MRPAVFVTSLLLLWALSACGPSEVHAGDAADLLVLEVGGEHPSLREALVAAGRQPPPAQRLRTTPWWEQPVGSPEAPATTPSEAPAAPPVEEPPPAPVPEFRLVPLRRGQTLIHLAKQELGNGNRYRDLLLWNGWTETQARSLREGTLVRVRIEPGAGR